MLDNFFLSFFKEKEDLVEGHLQALRPVYILRVGYLNGI